jgi:hypothetical protein
MLRFTALFVIGGWSSIAASWFAVLADTTCPVRIIIEPDDSGNAR